MSVPSADVAKDAEEIQKATEEVRADDKDVKSAKGAEDVKDVKDADDVKHVENSKDAEDVKDSKGEKDGQTLDDVKNTPMTKSRKRNLEEDDKRDTKLLKTETVTKDSDATTNLPAGSKAETEKDASDNTTRVQDHYNALSMQDPGDLTQRNESRILYMRNFNNWIKTMLINEYLTEVKQDRVHGTSLRVLDMCCGKGGDLLKWGKAKITHLICADISDLSVEHCQKRYNEMVSRDKERGFSSVYNAEFITADCTKIRLREKFRDASIQLDFVSCQFAFHYCFESLPQAECMLRNASESLRPGGYFIGTIPDAYDLVSRWQTAEGNKFGNDVYSVDFVCESKREPPLFGAKYNFHLEGVVDCPEFLVHLPTFCKLALKFGLKLVKFERFDSYYERMKNDGKSLLSKMQALETFPQFGDNRAQSSSEYKHVASYVASCKGSSHGVKVGTLSRSEWEVISLYAVFAFQKMKTNWNSEGKPEYEDL